MRGKHGNTELAWIWGPSPTSRLQMGTLRSTVAQKEGIVSLSSTIQLCRTLVLCRKSKLHQPAEVCGWLQGSWLTSFNLCPALSSFHPEELLPMRGNIQPSPSMATARTVYTLCCHFRPPCKGDASMRNNLRGHSWIQSIHYRSLAMACSDYKGSAPNFFTE